MKRIARTATTGIIQRGGISIKFTKEALESIGNADTTYAMPITPGHDPFCMPIGKVEETWIEPFGDEFAAMARLHIEEQYQRITHVKSETPLIVLDFEDSPNPFAKAFVAVEEHKIMVSTDLANFDSSGDHSTFLDDLKYIDEHTTTSIIGRHSLVPEPLLQFVISNPELSTALSIGIGWTANRIGSFLTYTVDETLKRAGDVIADSFSTKLQQILSSYRSRKSKDDRPVLVQVAILGEPDLILLDRVQNDEDVAPINLQKLAAEIEKYGDLLDVAQEVTFVRAGVDDWKFQYLKTRKGQVIGSLECHERTVQVYQEQSKND